MKKLTIIFLTAIAIAYSQPIGHWTIHSDMKGIVSAAGTDKGIWTVTTGGAFMYNPTDNSYATLTKANGLNSQVLTALCLDDNGKLWFGTGEGYLNIYDEKTGDIDRIMDIFNTTKTQKQINNLFVKGDSVFVSTDFGLSLINSNNLSFYDSFLKIGNFPAELRVKSAFKSSSIIYVITDNGVAVQKTGTQNLSVPESWNTYLFGSQISALSASKILEFNSQILLSTNNGVFRFINNEWQQFIMPGADVKDMYVLNNKLYLVSGNTLELYSNNEVNLLYENQNVVFNSIFVLNEQTIYIASNAGLIEYKQGNTNVIYPDGPLANKFVNLAVDESGNLWAATGKDGNGVGIMKYDGNKWGYFNRSTNPELPSNDYINVAAKSNSVFFSNWGNGFAIYSDNQFEIFTANNTELIGVPEDITFLTIASVQADSKGNIWILNHASQARKQLSVLTTNGNWYHYSIGSVTSSDALSNLHIDQYDTKWFIVWNGALGLYYFNEKNSFTNSSDDDWGYISTNVNDNLLSNNLSSLALDKRGQLWIGTSEGVNYITDPTQPEKTLSRQTAFSIRGQTVTCLAVDPLDQKWIGTKNGVFVLSSDGIQLLEHFTSSNSPLPNDDIKSIAINHITGIAYIGTDNGLAALTTSSIQPVESFNELFVYPNPLILDGTDTEITIDGLIKNTSIKILDISGGLIRSFVTPGGKVATWNGKDDEGNYVSTGIYIVVAYDDDANNVATAKVAVIRK